MEMTKIDVSSDVENEEIIITINDVETRLPAPVAFALAEVLTEALAEIATGQKGILSKGASTLKH